MISEAPKPSTQKDLLTCLERVNNLIEESQRMILGISERGMHKKDQEEAKELPSYQNIYSQSLDTQKEIIKKIGTWGLIKLFLTKN